MVPVAAIRPIVDRWLLAFEKAEDGYQALGASSGLTADAWRKRLSENRTSGWWRAEAIDPGDADEFLTAAGLTHLWQTELHGYAPAEGLSDAALRAWLVRQAKPRKRRGVPCRISDADLRKLHLLHTRADRLSLNQIAAQVWERYGYASKNSCATSISSAWRRLGLRARDRIEMVVAVSTKNGLSPRDWQERKRRRLELGLTQKGKVRQPLCAHSGCKRKARLTAITCHVHDPETGAAALDHLARMRARSPRQNPENLTTVGAIRPALVAWLAAFPSCHAGCKELHARTGIHPSLIARYAKKLSDDQAITRPQAARILGAIRPALAEAA